MSHAPDFDSMNETDVREIIVRPLIERLGYRHGKEATIFTEKTLRYERSFLGHKKPDKDPVLKGRADYICEVISYGRWVVEVKSPSEQLSEDVVQQTHTYAAHPEIAASFFLVTNGRSFRLFETSKLEQSLLEWNFEDQDEVLLRLFNLLNPEAFKKRAKATLVDPGKPLGKGLASRLQIVGGEVIYEEHSGDHPFLTAQNIAGLILPVTGGHVARSEDGRIHAHVTVARVTGYMHGGVGGGPSDEHDFYSAAEYMSENLGQPTIFQNLDTRVIPAGTVVRIPGLPPYPMPFGITTLSYTEAVGFVREDSFVGVMRLTYEFRFSGLGPTAFPNLNRPIPAEAHMTGAGRFEIHLQPGI